MYLVFLVAVLVSGSYATFQPWNNWSPCSKSCGKGIRHRERIIKFANTYYGEFPGKKDCNKGDCESLPPLINVALKSTVTASSIFLKGHPATNIVDNNLNTNFYVGTCTMTNKDKNPWVRIHLLYPALIKKVVVYNRGDVFPWRLNDLAVYIGYDSSGGDGVLCGKLGDMEGIKKAEINCYKDLSGMVVQLEIPGPQFLSLCEVQVYGKKINDVNECSVNNGGCSHNCVNKVGGFDCSCKDGYALDVDRKTCNDTNECSVNKGGCSHNCVNKDGGFDCWCNHGYALDVDGKSCTVHGGYSDWQSWSACTKTCGAGEISRTRTCTNPAPQPNGNDCSTLGESRETQVCYSRSCPVHGGYSAWLYWSACTKTCGGGVKYRIRTCTNPAPQHSGKDCSTLGAAREVQVCNSVSCPINGGYSTWLYWSECTKTCGGGEKYRIRTCTNPAPQHSGKDCSTLGAAKEFQVCNSVSCPVHGGYSNWSGYQSCIGICGDGMQKRTRTCDKPTPQRGGSDCTGLGPAEELRNCYPKSCRIHGGYGNWSGYQSCIGTCGDGMQKRTRTCDKPTPQHGGSDCTGLGPAEELRKCYPKVCRMNLALGKVTVQSFDYGSAYKAENAVDGDMSTSSFISTPRGWWRVDLGKAAVIYKVRVYTYSFRYIKDTNVAVGETTDVAKMTICGKLREDHKEAQRGRYYGYYVVCGTRAQGRFIQVTKNSGNAHLWMHEFEAWV